MMRGLELEEDLGVNAWIIPACWGCAHYIRKETCRAYPKHIPDRVFLNHEPHTAVRPDQVGEWVFEKKGE